MNKIFKVIYSKTRHCYVVVSELAKSHCKTAGSHTARSKTALTAAVLLAMGTFSVASVFMPMTAEAADKTKTDGSNFVGVERTDGLLDDSKYGNYGGKGANGADSITLGLNAQAGAGTITIGDRNAGASLGSVYVGQGDIAKPKLDTGGWATSIGYNSDATGYGSIALGSNAVAKNSYAKDSKGESLELNQTYVDNGVTKVRLNSKPDIQRASVAIGYGASADNGNIAIGSYSDASTDLRTVADDTAKAYLTDKKADSYVSVGKSDALRRISNVADGAADSDVATIRQLKALSDKAGVYNEGWGIKIADEKDDNGNVTKKNAISVDRNLGNNSTSVTEVSNTGLILGGDFSGTYRPDEKYGNYGATGQYAVTLGGTGNRASGESSVAAGGRDNTADGNQAFVGGGNNNVATGSYSANLGGTGNTASGESSVVTGGAYNTASGTKSFVGGGHGNIAVGDYSAVIGGWDNRALGDPYGSSITTVVGGYQNTANGYHAMVTGGYQNVAWGRDTLVSGGRYNTVLGEMEDGWSDQHLSDASAFGGEGSVVQGLGSVGLAGGSTGKTAYLALAAGYQSVVTDGAAKLEPNFSDYENLHVYKDIASAIGYQSTANEAGTISFGHDAGDVSGYTVNWEEDKDPTHDTINYSSNDYTKTPTVTENYYDDAYYNRLVKVADGIDNHDAVTREQVQYIGGIYGTDKNDSNYGGRGATGTNSVAIGSNAVATEDNVVSFGNPDIPAVNIPESRKITHSVSLSDTDKTTINNVLGFDVTNDENWSKISGFKDFVIVSSLGSATEAQDRQKLENNPEFMELLNKVNTAILNGTLTSEQWISFEKYANGTEVETTDAVNIPAKAANYRRVVNMADGINPHDAVAMEQLEDYAKTDASNIGNSNKSKDDWGKALGAGTLASSTAASNSNQLITGKTLYNYDKPNPDGTYVKLNQTTGQNLSALDTQVKANTDALTKPNHNIKYYAVDETTLPKLTNFNGKDYSNEKNNGAKGMGSIAAGFNTHADGIISTVAGSYSGVIGTGLQGATALSYGTFNINQNTDATKVHSGVANSIIGQVNMTKDSNAAIIYGAGNIVTDSYRPIDEKKAETILGSVNDPAKLGEAMKDAVKTSGGQVMVMGGGNNVESAYMTQVVGVGNTVKGNQVQNTKNEWVTDTSDTAIKDYDPEKSSQYNYVDGFSNEVINGKHDYVIGANNKLSGDSYDDDAKPIKRSNRSNIVIGDNHILTREQNTVIIGSIDTKDEKGNSLDTQTKARDAVIIGHNANATNDKEDANADNAVAIGRSAKATGGNAVTIGVNTSAGAESITIGSESSADPGSNIAIGRSVQVYGYKITNAVALGVNTKALVSDGVAIGSESQATVKGNSAEGYDPVTGKDSTDDTATWKATKAAVSIGTADGKVTRQINGLAAGTNDTDAVNVAQLKKLEEVASDAHTALTVEGNPAGTQDEETKKDVYTGKNILLHESKDAKTGKVTYDMKLSKDIVLGDTTPGNGGSLNVYSDTTEGNNLSNHVSINGSTISVNYKNKADSDTRGVILGVGEEDSKPDGYIAFNNVEGGYTYLHASTDASDDKKGRLEYVGTDGNKKYIANLDDVSTAVNNAKIHFYSVNSKDTTAGNYNNDGATGSNALAAGVSALALGQNATAVGSGAQAQEDDSSAFGHNAIAFKRNSTAVGSGTQAQGDDSSAFGYHAIAFNTDSTAIGSGATAQNDRAIAIGGHAMGQGSVQIGTDSTAQKTNAVAVGGSALGEKSVEVGTDSTAQGNSSVSIGGHAIGNNSVAIGRAETSSAGEFSTAIGGGHTNGDYNIAIGNGTSTSNKYAITVGGSATGEYAVSVGNSANATNNGAVALGYNTTATGKASTAINAHTTAEDATAIGLANATHKASTAIGNRAEAVAEQATAIGDNTTANGKQATAIGGASAGGEASTAIGLNSTASKKNSTAIGGASVGGEGSAAVGMSATVSGDNGVAVGAQANVGKQGTGIGYGVKAGESGTAIGYSAISADQAAAIGMNANANKNAVAIGQESGAWGESSVAIGQNSGTNNFAVAIGQGSGAWGENSVAIGKNTNAWRADSIVLGMNSKSAGDKGVQGYDPKTETNSTDISAAWQATNAAVSIGRAEEKDTNGKVTTTAITRQLSNLAAGTNDTDAVNVAQLKSLQSGLTENLTGKGLKFAANSGAEYTAKLGTTVTIQGTKKKENHEYTADNLTTEIDGSGNITILMDKDMSAEKLAVNGKDGKEGKPGIAGSIGIKGQDGKAGVGIDGKDGISIKGHNGKDGVTIKGIDGVNGVDGAEGHIGLNGKDGMTDIFTTTGKPGLNGKDGETMTRIVYKDPKGTEHEAATLDDGLKFKGDDDTVIAKNLNNTMEIIGGADSKNLTEGNIGVNSTDKGQLKVQLAKDLKGITSISNQKTTKVDGKDVTTGAKIDLGEDGNISVNGGKITNVGSGIEKDANGKYTVTNQNKGNAANIGDVQNMVNDAKKELTDGANGLNNKANIDASNIGANLKGADGKTEATEAEKTKNENDWGKAIGTGKIEKDNGQLVTGKTVYEYNKPIAEDGKKLNYVSEKKTTGQNLGALDSQVKTNADNIEKNTKSIQNITNNVKNLSDNAVQYDKDSNKTKVTLGGEGGTTITNVKDGALNDKSTDAVNGKQLYNEVHVDKDGTYIKSKDSATGKDMTVAQNLSALDTGLKTTSDLIHTNDKGDTIQIGGSSTATKIDVNGKDGKGRVITGVVTDAGDPNSAANVGYVNGLTAANTQQIYRDMNNAYSRLDTNINRAAAGSNALAALHPLEFDPADKASFAVGYGHYHNANAAAVGAFYQPNANTMVNMGISLGNGDPGFNAGVSFKIGKGSTYNGVSKAEMAQTIHDQAAEISTIKANDAAKDKRIDALEKENQEMKKQIQEILARLNG